MDLSRLSTAHKIAVGGAVVLVVAMFLPWYKVDFGGFGSVSANAWDAGILAWGACVAGIAAGVILAMKAMGTKDVTAGGKSAEQIAMILGIAAFVMAVLRLITESTAAAFGMFIGIAASAAVAYGAWAAAKQAGHSPASHVGGTPAPPGT